MATSASRVQLLGSRGLLPARGATVPPTLSKSLDFLFMNEGRRAPVALELTVPLPRTLSTPPTTTSDHGSLPSPSDLPAASPPPNTSTSTSSSSTITILSSCAHA
eukprot:6180150-Pleurochrysis_carterae.AAC.2